MWLASEPSFSRSHVRQNLCGKEIVHVGSILKSIPPEMLRCMSVGQETSHHVQQDPVAPLCNAVLLGRVAISELLRNAERRAEGAESGVEELATTI